MYSFHLFLIASTSTRSLSFMSLIVSIFGQNVPLISAMFLKRSLVFPLLLYSSRFTHYSLKKAFLSLHALLWNSAFSWIHLSLYPLLFASLLSLAICKTSSDDHFAFLLFFLFGVILFAASCTILQISIHSSSSTLFTGSNPLNLFITSIVYSCGI